MLLLFCQQNPDTTIAATFCHFLSWSFCSVLKRSKDLLLRVSSLSLAPWYLKLFNNRASHVVNPDGSRLICTVVVMTEQIWGFSSLNWHFCNGTIKIGFITRQLCQKKDHWKEKNKKQQNPKKITTVLQDLFTYVDTELIQTCQNKEIPWSWHKKKESGP